MYSCLCQPLPSWKAFQKIQGKPRKSRKQLFCGDAKGQHGYGTKLPLSVCCRTNNTSRRVHQHIPISKNPWNQCTESVNPLECLFLPSLVATCVLVAGIRQSRCLEICTRPRGEERFAVTEGFPRTEFLLRRWKRLFRAVLGEMFFLSVGELGKGMSHGLGGSREATETLLGVLLQEESDPTRILLWLRGRRSSQEKIPGKRANVRNSWQGTDGRMRCFDSQTHSLPSARQM